MQIALRQREKFAKRARVLHDAQDCALRAVPAETLAAPVATAATEIDFAHHAPANQFAPARLHYFADELMARNSVEAVIAALQFQIRIADAAAQQA